MKKLKGIIAAPFTAFTEENKLNLSIIAQQVAMYKRNGVSGVFVCGTTGESSALTLGEKKQLFEEWTKYKSEDFKVIAFLGGTCLEECQELALTAQKLNMDAVSVTAPYYFKPTDIQALASFCAEVAKMVPSTPFYYYHIPSFTNSNFLMIDLLKAIDGTIPNFAGIKYTYENLMDYQLCLNYENNKYDILWGRDEMLLGALAMGAQGAVGSTYGYMSPIYNTIIDAYHENDMQKAQQYQLLANKYITLLSKYGGGAGKAFMKSVGLDLGKHRTPVTNLNDEQYLNLTKDLDALDFKIYSNK